MTELIKREYPNHSIRLANLPPLLKAEIPEFWESRVLDDANEPHIVAGDFAIWLGQTLSEKDESHEDIIQRSCLFIERLVEEGDDEVKNLAVVSILEVLVDEVDQPKNLRERFRGKALEFLDRILLHYYN